MKLKQYTRKWVPPLPGLQSFSPGAPLLKVTCVFFQEFSIHMNCMYFVNTITCPTLLEDSWPSWVWRYNNIEGWESVPLTHTPELCTCIWGGKYILEVRTAQGSIIKEWAGSFSPSWWRLGTMEVQWKVTWLVAISLVEPSEPKAAGKPRVWGAQLRDPYDTWQGPGPGMIIPGAVWDNSQCILLIGGGGIIGC